MAVNKVEFGGDTLIDLTQDTVDPTKLVQGYTAHDKSGAAITGSLADPNAYIQDIEDLKELVGTTPVSEQIEGAIAGIETVQGPPGAPGVYYGTTPPTDPAHPVWINPSGNGVVVSGDEVGY